MSLTAFLDKGADLGPDGPCLTVGGRSMSYGEVQAFSRRVARALVRSGARPGDAVAVLSGNDPTSFACVFGIARAGAVWCPVNPRNEAAENRDLLDFFDCRCLIFQAAFAPLVAKILRGARPQDLPVEGAEKIDLAVNLKTAELLGLTMPRKIMLRADAFRR